MTQVIINEDGDGKRSSRGFGTGFEKPKGDDFYTTCGRFHLSTHDHQILSQTQTWHMTSGY